DDPTSDDILYLKENFQLHPLVLSEFTSPSQRPRAEEFDNCLYIVIHIPLFDKDAQIGYSGELDIVITKNHVITSHNTENLPIKSILREFEEDSAFKEQAFSKSSGFLFYSIMERLLSASLPKLDHINEKINEIEEGIFMGYEKEMVRTISTIKRDLLTFRRSIKPQRSILESLVQKKYRLLEDGLNEYFQELIGINIRAWNALENIQEIVESLEKTNSALLSHKINEAMRLLTAVSLITFTLSVITGIFSMIPFASFDLAESQLAFWIILGIMATITTIALTLFRRKRWF
ncbi:MAG: magnesium transporter CorA family protein, partial [Candidatus Moranbacteria bacterium]|nr:magnesium transporter CorA family protein [Candidatus Moranbacteria bacterium]